MKKKLLLYGCVVSIFSGGFALAVPMAEWTILTIMQADNNLAPFALQNINDMQKNMVGDRINNLVYWHRPRSNQRLKYKIKSNGVIEEEVLEIKTAPNMEQEVVDAMQWAVSNNPAKYYMLNLWNHGTGVIDQQAWGSKINHQLRYFNENSWLEVPGLDLYDDRGILYSDSTKSFMTNQQLAGACKQIKDTVLKKKIDIIGMDACLMAMLEVAYQIKDYGNYLVSSQNLEPGRGWNYGAFLKNISSTPELFPPLKIAQNIVDTYAQYYSGRYSFYTLSVIDLSGIDTIKKNLDSVISTISSCYKAEIQDIYIWVKQAATTAIKFDASEFIDLHSLYTNLIKQVRTYVANKKKSGTIQRISLDQIKILAELQGFLENGQQLIINTVKANKVGGQFTGAQGISIYFPQGSFHSSYAKTMFATDSAWSYLVQGANLKHKN